MSRRLSADELARRIERRFWDRAPLAPSGCREWSGRRNSKGYGRLFVDGRRWLAHRHAWVLANGPIPDGMFVLHRCDNPPCCEPSHLFLGTLADNNADRDRKGHHVSLSGERHGMSKLTGPDASEIRRLYAEGPASQYALAERFGVSQATISRVVRGVIWQSPSRQQVAS